MVTLPHRGPVEAAGRANRHEAQGSGRAPRVRSSLSQSAYGLRLSYALLSRTGLQGQSLRQTDHCPEMFVTLTILFRSVRSENGHMSNVARSRDTG